eukprot:2977540-Amphidinium_carterae.1
MHIAASFGTAKVWFSAGVAGWRHEIRIPLESESLQSTGPWGCRDSRWTAAPCSSLGGFPKLRSSPLPYSFGDAVFQGMLLGKA